MKNISIYILMAIVVFLVSLLLISLIGGDLGGIVNGIRNFLLGIGLGISVFHILNWALTEIPSNLTHTRTAFEFETGINKTGPQTVLLPCLTFETLKTRVYLGKTQEVDIQISIGWILWAFTITVTFSDE